MNKGTKNVTCVIELSRKLLFCADRGDMQREDDSCGVLFGVVRDSAYRMLDLALKERQKHVNCGLWDGCDDEQYPGVYPSDS